MPELQVEGLIIGTEGSLLLRARVGTISVDPASIAAVTRGAPTFTLAGAKVGDIIVAQPPAALNDDLVFCGADVTADNTVTLYLYNPTAGPIDDAAQTWRYLWIDATR